MLYSYMTKVGVKGLTCGYFRPDCLRTYTP